MDNYIMIEGKKINISSETAENLKKAFIQPKKEFVTVTDGFHKTCGSLKLKECWVKDVCNSWAKAQDFEVIAREDRFKYPFIIMDSRGTVGYYKHLKFRPFSPENPPPVDWPVEIDGTETKRHFKRFLDTDEFAYYGFGKTSHTINAHEDECTSYDVKFLNIEPVEED